MNKSKFLIAFSLLFICFNFTSCDDEPIDPALLLVDENPNNNCAAPAAFEVSNLIGGTTADLSWTPAVGTGAWQIQYGAQGFAVGSGTQINATSTEATVTGLNGTTSYEFYIRTACNATEFSGWVGPVVLGGSIGSCPTPTGLNAVRSSGNTEISVTWAPVASAVSYQVQYGAAGFALGSGTTVSASGSPKTITGLLATTAYDFYVRSNCSATDNSSWAGPITVAAVGGATTGDYWPRAVGNQWIYNVGGVAQDPFVMISTDVVNGLNYFTFNTPDQPNTAATRLRKLGSDYFIKTEQITHTGQFTGTTTGNEVIILKDNLAVGGTWTDSFVQTTSYTGLQPIVLNISVLNTIEAKNVTAVVNGTTYTNVIKTTRVTTVGNDVYNGAYWFAKDIGPIKIVNGTNIQELASYDLN